MRLYKGMLYNPFVPLGENDGINILYCYVIGVIGFLISGGM